MNITWKAALAGGSVVGIGIGGFAGLAAADGVDRPEPGQHTLQQSASAGSPLSAPVRLKDKGDSWYPQLAVAGINGATSVDSPVSVDSPAGFDSPASPASPESPGQSFDSPASPNSPAGPGGAGSVSADSPASPPAPSPGSGSGGSGGSGS